jgi:hypothetical protein
MPREGKNIFYSFSDFQWQYDYLSSMDTYTQIHTKQIIKEKVTGNHWIVTSASILPDLSLYKATCKQLTVKLSKVKQAYFTRKSQRRTT